MLALSVATAVVASLVLAGVATWMLLIKRLGVFGAMSPVLVLLSFGAILSDYWAAHYIHHGSLAALICLLVVVILLALVEYFVALGMFIYDRWSDERSSGGTIAHLRRVG